jgi:hypothetical protein
MFISKVPVLSHDPKHWIGFGDLFGDGRIHRIKITNKSVESWASFYGNRGRKSIARLIKENMETIGVKIQNIGGTRAISINQSSSVKK